MFRISWTETEEKWLNLTRDEALELLEERDGPQRKEVSDQDIRDALKVVIEDDVADVMESTDSSRWSVSSIGADLTDVEVI